MTTEGKWRVEGKRGPRKRPRVMTEGMEVAEETKRWQKEDSRLQLGAKITEALWRLNDQLASIQDELVASQEAVAEELRFLH